MRIRDKWNTFNECVRKHPEIIELPDYKPKGSTSYPQSFENALIMIAKKNHVNPSRLNVDDWWLMDGAINDLKGNSIFYYDAEYTNREDLFRDDGKVKFSTIHVPIEKIDYFKTHPKSVYVRGNLETILVLRGNIIVENFDKDNIAWDVSTKWGSRDFIAVHSFSAYQHGHVKSGSLKKWMIFVKELMGLEYYWV